ncbi:hypothetical protein D3C81_953390 [compost metagenome]
MTAALALAVNDLFVRQDRSQCRAPVHRNFGYIGQPFLIQLDKNPLRPFVIIRIGRADLAVPIVGETQRLDLAPEIVDILNRNVPRMLACIKRMLLRRQSEGIPAHRMEYVVTAHPFEAGDDIRGRVTFRMADVKTGPRWIREHVKRIKLRFARLFPRFESVMLIPVSLPFRFDGLGSVNVMGHVVVRHNSKSSLKYQIKMWAKS